MSFSLVVPCCRAGVRDALLLTGVFAVQASADPHNANRGWTGIEHGDIRFDEDYARFYEAYSGQRKLPPPVEGRTLYSELGLLQQKQQLLAQQTNMLGSATPPPNQALLMAGGLTPGGEQQQQQPLPGVSVGLSYAPMLNILQDCVILLWSMSYVSTRPCRAQSCYSND